LRKFAAKFDGPYRVVNFKGDSAVELESVAGPHLGKRQHRVVNMDRLKRPKDPPKLGLHVDQPLLDEDDDDGEFTVEAIVAARGVGRKRQYKVKWLGYPGEDTWEPFHHLTHCADIIAAFERSRQPAPV